MEVALFVALLLRAFVLADRLTRAAPDVRAAKQWRLGLVGVALVWTRPEAVVVVAVLAVLAARHARSQSPLAALLRVASPGAFATLSLAALNWIETRDFASAGARLKLVSSNPYSSDLDRAREVLLNALHFEWKVIEGGAVATPRFVWVLFVLALAPLASRRTREIGAAILASCLSWTALVSFNGAARFQGFRYYAPAVVMLLVAIALGLSILPRVLAFVVGVFVACSAAWRAPRQIRIFRGREREHPRSTNRRRQKAPRAGSSRFARAPRRRRRHSVFFGARRHRRARARWVRAEAVHARGAERRSVDARAHPTRRAGASARHSLALYPNWFPVITSRFGHEIDRVTIDHNVICGGPTKIIATADWTALDGDEPPKTSLDELDVADVDSEGAHDYESPAPTRRVGRREHRIGACSTAGA